MSNSIIAEAPLTLGTSDVDQYVGKRWSSPSCGIFNATDIRRWVQAMD